MPINITVTKHCIDRFIDRFGNEYACKSDRDLALHIIQHMLDNSSVTRITPPTHELKKLNFAIFDVVLKFSNISFCGVVKKRLDTQYTYINTVYRARENSKIEGRIKNLKQKFRLPLHVLKTKSNELMLTN